MSPGARPESGNAMGPAPHPANRGGRPGPPECPVATPGSAANAAGPPRAGADGEHRDLELQIGHGGEQTTHAP
eukprot:11208613-Lingulodinium_polyedra.AAC.1